MIEIRSDDLTECWGYLDVEVRNDRDFFDLAVPFDVAVPVRVRGELRICRHRCIGLGGLPWEAWTCSSPEGLGAQKDFYPAEPFRRWLEGSTPDLSSRERRGD